MDRMLKSTKEYAISRVFAMRYTPVNKRVYIEDRPRSSFLLPIKGRISYECEGDYIDVSAGEIVYLPKTINYRYTVYDCECEFMQVEFDYFEEENGMREYILFSQTPTKKTTNVNQASKLIQNIIDGYNSQNHYLKIKANASLMELISLFLKDTNYGTKIEPALRYIEEHKFRKIYINNLSELCKMSESHFRKIFRETTGYSPVEYKNRLIIECALQLLENNEYNISEIASLTGFDDVYSFSKFFKREMGYSPSEFRKSRI